MNKNNEIYRHLFLELLIIVVGVLTALGAQSIYQDWTERNREYDFLVDLLEEYKINEQRLQNDIESTQRAVDAAKQWRSSILEKPAINDESIIPLYVASHNNARFDPITGVLRSLIDGGDLELIQNRQLRAALAGWGDRTEEQIRTSQIVDMMRSDLTQFLISEEKLPPAQALQLDLLLLEIISNQQAKLMEPLQNIISMLEAEIAK